MSAKVIALRPWATADAPVMSDEALLAGCATGDGAALGALFDRFSDAVFRFAARLPRTDELARDDLVQATFLEVSRTAASFRGGSTVKTWILGIAANVARHTLRSEQRRRVHQARFLEKQSCAPMLVDDQVERRQLLTYVAEALETLPRDQQLAFILVDLEQLPGAEVARILDIPEGTLWRRLHTARKAMRAAIEERVS
ncbi:MAG: RNA polymerase sigma factor [Myxococcota bacterium]|nr:RNA polymerase sigma factor [Myxococcota bacterium]